MIYTLTLNTSVDHTVYLPEKTRPGGVCRASSEYLSAGGKGINCAVMLRRLGHEVTALGFAGGVTGEMVRETLINEGVVCRLVPTLSHTRINTKIISENVTEINGKGTGIRESELDKLKEELRKIKDAEFLTLSGSIPEGIPGDIYESIMKSALAENIPVVLDAGGKLLRSCLKYRPFLIKPNLSELSEMYGVEIEDTETAVKYASASHEAGARNVLVSMGAEGAVLCTEGGGIYVIPAVPVNVKSTVGSGDSMVAGFLSGYLKSADEKVWLRMACAAGSATAASEGIADGTYVEELFRVTAGTVIKNGVTV